MGIVIEASLNKQANLKVGDEVQWFEEDFQPTIGQTSDMVEYKGKIVKIIGDGTALIDLGDNYGKLIRLKYLKKLSSLRKEADGDDILESVDYGYTISDLTDKDLLETIKNEEEGLAGILEHNPNATEKVMEPLVLLYEERDRRGLGKKKSWLKKKADVEKDKAWEEYKKLRTEIKINQQFGDRSLNKELWNKVEKMEEKNPDFDQKYYWEIETENN